MCRHTGQEPTRACGVGSADPLGPPSTSITGDVPVPVPTRQLAERSQHECTYSDAATLSRAMESTEMVDGAQNAANEHFSLVVRAACRQVAGYGEAWSLYILLDSHCWWPLLVRWVLRLPPRSGGIQGDVRCGVHDPAGSLYVRCSSQSWRTFCLCVFCVSNQPATPMVRPYLQRAERPADFFLTSGGGGLEVQLLCGRRTFSKHKTSRKPSRAERAVAVRRRVVVPYLPVRLRVSQVPFI